ncbi:MAG: cation:proton antiporter, partial [Saprospiraceae bacterium]
PHWKPVFIVAWSGMRGVVSLAAALSIPLMINEADAFPFRNEILFITFIVILITLVVQGLSLPYLIRKLNIIVKDNSEEKDIEIQMHLVTAILAYIDEHYKTEVRKDKAFKMLRERYEHFQTLQQKQLKKQITEPVHPKYFEALLELIEVRRKALAELKLENKYPDELLRNAEQGIDHEEARLRMQVKTEN